MIKNKRLIAIFDLDGTVMPGITIVDVPRFLSKKFLFNPSSLNKIDYLKKSYSDKQVGYNQFIDGVVEEYAKGLENLKVKEVQKGINEYWKEKIKTVYPFLNNVLKWIRSVNGISIVLSGSEYYSLLPFLKKYTFNQINTTTIEVAGKKYNGKIKFNSANLNNKKIIVNKIYKEFPKENYFYIGFGDSVADLAFLSKVNQPIVVGIHDADLQNKIHKNSNWINITNPEEHFNINKLKNS